MSEYLDMFYLLSHGLLPLSAVDPTTLPNRLTPAYRAFEYALSRNHTFPLVVPDIAAIATTRFHAKEEAKSLFTELTTYKPGSSKIESVQQSILLRRIVSAASDQLISGKYDLPLLGTYASHVTSVGVQSLVQAVGAPKDIEASRVNYITGIDVLDNLLGGIHDELIVVSARPKNGKSNFFVNLVCLSPKKRFLYITVSDYGYHDLCQVLYDCDPSSTARKNIHIADFTAFGATVLDVESVVREVKPDVVIVDRAEELSPLIKAREPRWEVKAIFKTMRQIAKKYKVPVFVDAQQSESGERYTEASGNVSPSQMAEDKTGRYATLDLFIGLQRLGSGGHKVRMSCTGRRKALPGTVEVTTNEMGRYE